MGEDAPGAQIARQGDPEEARAHSGQPQAGTRDVVQVEDGPGRRLGRSFKVKLWPTLVFLRDGVEVERLARPQAASDIADALRRLT